MSCFVSRIGIASFRHFSASISEKIADDRADSAVEDFRVRYETKEKEDRLMHEQDMSKIRLIVVI